MYTKNFLQAKYLTTFFEKFVWVLSIFLQKKKKKKNQEGIKLCMLITIKYKSTQKRDRFAKLY